MLPPLLASDFNGMVTSVFGPPWFFAILSLVINARWGRRKWWGLLIGLLPVGIAGLLLVLDLRSGLEMFYWFMSGVPFLGGILGLFLWSRPEKKSDDGS